MLLSLSPAIVITSCVRLILALPSVYHATNDSIHFDDLYARQDNTYQDDFLSYIKKIAAVGDSYSAGIGAGNRLTTGSAFDDGSDYACSRYDHSYPYIVNGDPRLGDPAGRSFQFKSCSGAVIHEVVDKQLPVIDSGQDVILLSAGGNDVGLVDILNQCVFQWTAITSAALDRAKSAAQKYSWANDVDWNKLQIGCDGQMDYAQSYIDGSEFTNALDGVIAAAKGKLAANGMIYYTGYAKFFAETLTTDCDKVTWTTWVNSIEPELFQLAQYLTVDHRRRMNQLVEAVNKKISDAVNRAGSQVKFIDYDKYFGQFHGRFCEAGVDESTVESNTRTGLMFYELNTWDPFGGSPWKRDNAEPANGTVEADQNIFAQITLLVDGNATLRNTEQAPSSSVNTQNKAFAIPKLLPDGYGRVFHPQILGHQIIASLIVFEMENTWIAADGLDPFDETYTFGSCSYQPPDANKEDPNAPQTIAIASYINPIADPGAWNKLIGYNSDKVSVLVANVLNGPDSKVNNGWKDVIDRAHNSGKKVLGYVRTGYLGLSAQHFTTRLGSTDIADWIAQIEYDVMMWMTLYGNSIDGIFFDEGWPECGPNNIYADIYTGINRKAKELRNSVLTVLNPGSPMAKCYDSTMDTLLTFESSYEQYTNNYVPNDWTPSDPRKIWHIIYNVPQDQVANVAQLSKQRGAGLVEINNNIMPNPYDKLPSDDYMAAFMGAIGGGSPRIATVTFGPPGAQKDDPVVQGLQETGHDYSSVTYSWPSSNGATGYRLYTQQQASLGWFWADYPAYTNKVTVGGFDPTLGPVLAKMTPLRDQGFEWTYIGDTQSTLNPLPGGRSIVNLQHTLTDTDIVIEADVLMPYAFVRMYLCCTNTTCVADKPAWTIQWNNEYAAYCRYMSEGLNFFSYAGTGTTWSWTPVTGGRRDDSGYHYKWTLPISAANEVSVGGLAFAVQGEGYNDLTNIFSPCTYMENGQHVTVTPKPGNWCADGQFSRRGGDSNQTTLSSSTRGDDYKMQMVD